MCRPKITDFVNDCSKRHIEAYSLWKEFNGTAEMHTDAQKVGRRHLQDYLFNTHFESYNFVSIDLNSNTNTSNSNTNSNRTHTRMHTHTHTHAHTLHTHAHTHTLNHKNSIALIFILINYYLRQCDYSKFTQSWIRFRKYLTQEVPVLLLLLVS